ncbi:MAG: diguanylate cyclase, partial [bacterium]|nr:diguanylate cyclase [bacterium]
EIALSNFRRDEEQFEDVPNDGVLHSDGIPNVEIGFELNTYAQLDFRHASFVWSAPRGPTYLALALGLVTGILLLVRSSRLRSVSARLDSPSGDDSATVVYPLTCLVLTVSVLADVQHTLTITEALALSGMFVLVVVDKLLASASRSHILWDLRYVILLSAIWWVGEALPPLFPVVLLFIALLSAASKQRRGVLLTAVALPLAAVVLRPPLLDITGKGPTLFYIAMVGALALGAAEILRSSEVRDQHRRTAMMYRGILEQISDGVVLVEFNGRIELANRGFESLLSADPGELLGHHVSDFLRAKDGRPANLLTLSTVGDKSEMTLANSVTGLRRDVLVAAHTVRHKDLPDRLQLTVSDISERKLIERELTRANERLSRLSATDELTGLDNRREFERSLTSEWSRCARSGLPLTVLYCDIDAFKTYNDCYGHRAGDKALQCVADALTGCLNRPGDSVARYGGEEFLVLLPETDPEKIKAFTEKIRATVEELGLPHDANPAAGVLTVSIGVASCVPSQDNSGDELIHAADMALYEAKNSGRNRVVFHDPSMMNPR